jgi:hypothetical protein
MKQYILLLVVVILVSWLMASHRSVHVAPCGPSRHGNGSIHARDGQTERRIMAEARHKARRALAEARDEARQALDEARQAFDQARNEAHQAFAEARDDVHQALAEARDDVHQALADAHVVQVSDDEAADDLPPPPQPPPAERDDADGLPVRIVPGTRVTDATIGPPAPSAPPARLRGAIRVHPPAPNAAPAAPEVYKLAGLISATKQRAENEARRSLRDFVVSWLEPDVPRGWTPPAQLLDALVRNTRFEAVEKAYGTLYVAELVIDASPARRAAFVAAYNHELVHRRLITLGGTLAFVLTCLAVVSGYIRTDEVTKGYYTNRLRLLAAAGVGAAGVIIYRLFT